MADRIAADDTAAIRHGWVLDLSRQATPEQAAAWERNRTAFLDHGGQPSLVHDMAVSCGGTLQ